jgi:hypothetical protein
VPLPGPVFLARFSHRVCRKRGARNFAPWVGGECAVRLLLLPAGDAPLPSAGSSGWRQPGEGSAEGSDEGERPRKSGRDSPRRQLQRDSQPVSFQLATVFWTQISVQHTFGSQMKPERPPTNAANSPLGSLLPNPERKLRDQFHEVARSPLDAGSRRNTALPKTL